MKRITLHGLYLLTIILSCVLSPTEAIYKSQVGSYDWHHTWVGHPNEAFVLDSKHILVSTHTNIIASIHTDSGVIEWRQQLDNEPVAVRVSDVGILTFSSTSELAQMWDKATGRLMWEYSSSDAGHFGSVSPVVLNNGESILVIGTNILIKLDKDGKEVWKHVIESDRILSSLKMKLFNKGDTVYLINEPEDESETPILTIHTIDGMTGEMMNTLSIPCATDDDVVSYAGDYVLWIKDETLVWTTMDKEDVKSATIQSLVETLPNADEYTASTISIIGDIEAHTNSFILATVDMEDDQPHYSSAHFSFTHDGSLKLTHNFGTQDSLGGVDFLDTTSIRALKTSPQELIIHLPDREEAIKIPFNFEITGNINYIKVISTQPIRLFLVTDGSSVFYLNEDGIMWSREEALSSIAASEFLDLPEEKLWTQMSDELHETQKQRDSESTLTRYIHRLSTHMIELHSLPSWIVSYFMGLTTSTLDKKQDKKISMAEAQSCWLNRTQPETIYRDNFGLRKLLISVTRSGKVIAQDTSHQGKIIWTRYLESFSFTDVYVVRTASVEFPPVIVAVGSTHDEVGGQATGFVRLNALTGENYVSSSPLSEQFFEPIIKTTVGVDKIMRLPIEDPEERTYLLAIYEAHSGRVYIYPDTYETHKKFVEEFLPDFYFSYLNSNGYLQGFKVIEGYRGSLKVLPLYSFSIPADETIVTFSHSRPEEKVALIGRALGNRNVLYKYLNPHLFAVVTKNTAMKYMNVRLIDSVKGSILYENIHKDVDLDTNEVHIAQSENWFVYHFWRNGEKFKGYEVAVLELYEGQFENERIDRANFSSFDNIQPHVISSAFTFPHAVSTIGITTTRNGISIKDILFGLPTHQIMGVSKRLLDPRRPTNKPTSEQQEEMLYPYAPIPDERRFFLTYTLDVLGIKSIITNPSLLESTSLVFAYGTDTFFTRVSPSKQFDVLSPDFSKIQLILTITSLAIAIRITGPMVRRKHVNALWK